jgi:uncharacterized RDD family membrane protein YckC
VAPGAYRGPLTLNLGSRGKRFLAQIVDGIVQAVPTLLLSWPWLSQLRTAIGDLISWAESLPAGATPTQAEILDQLSQSGFWGAVIMFVLISFLVSMIYETAFVALAGATPGKMLTGLRVVKADTGGRVGWGWAFARWATRVIPGQVLGVLGLSIIWLLDPAWCLWDSRKQCLHDKAAGTLVVTRY